jgi:putative flippase GtrA
MPSNQDHRPPSPPSTESDRPKAAHRFRTQGFASLLKGGDAGLRVRGLRFALSGGLVAVYYLTATTVLANVVGLPFQLALVIGYTTAICLHFLLQRFFVWVREDEFALAAHHQLGRYLLIVGIQYGITVASTAFLPGALGVPTEVVYLITAGFLAMTNFLVMGSRVFHQSQEAPLAPRRAHGSPC